MNLACEKMGSDEAKLEKKRLKAQVKAEKARAKSNLPLSDELSSQPISPSKPVEKIPWYKDPHWIKAIVGLATLVIMIITLALTLRN